MPDRSWEGLGASADGLRRNPRLRSARSFFPEPCVANGPDALALASGSRHGRSMTGLSYARMGLALGMAVLVLASNSWAGGDWNDDGIQWRSLDEGLAEAEQHGKPICLVVYTEWCPHCTNYSRVFHDGDVEKAAEGFVMIRLDQDRKKTLSARYAPDGAYIPRTMFLDSHGVIDPEIKINRKDYVYFYDEHDPAHLRKAMNAAHAKLAKPVETP